jgi:hypothetical protein
MRYSHLIFTIGIILVGCEIQKDDYDTSNPILNKAYSTDYFYPDGFYFESIDSGGIYYINTLSIKPLDQRQLVSIQLCSDDIDEARYWSELTNSYSSQNRILKSERQTGKYFEFKRESPVNKGDIVLDRVHKQSYFLPLMDSYKVTDTIGQIPETLLQNVDIKQYIEYLWSSGAIGYPTKVIESNLRDTTIGYIYKINSIDIVHGDFHVDDIIYLYNNTFIINNINGIITRHRLLLEEIKGISR